MTVENDFLAFATSSSANVLDQADYAALAALLTGFTAGTAQSTQVNKVLRQSSLMAAVLAQFIVQQTGQPAIDDGTTATLLANLTAAVKASPSGVVGQSRNLTMSITAASATATLTADEIIVETALGGLRYCLANFNKTINLATTGAGGMDAGSAPASGFVALYAIYNPTTGASALLATNAATKQGNVYGGANMPAGYTASALVSVWLTNASGQFAQGIQIDRMIEVQLPAAIITSIQQTSMTQLTLPIPINARAVSVSVNILSTAVSNLVSNISSAPATSFPAQQIATNTNTQIVAQTRPLAIVTPKTIYYTATASSGTMTLTLIATQYFI